MSGVATRPPVLVRLIGGLIGCVLRVLCRILRGFISYELGCTFHRDDMSCAIAEPWHHHMHTQR